jgi:hypothetical protein
MNGKQQFFSTWQGHILLHIVKDVGMKWSFPSIRPVYPSRHGLLTPTGRREQLSDGPIKLAPLKEAKMLWQDLWTN